MRKGKIALWMLMCSACIAALMSSWPVYAKDAVRTAVVQSGELVKTILLTARVEYAGQSPCISFKSGAVSEVYAKAGENVQRGDLLFKLDTQAEEQALASLYQMKYEQQTSLNLPNEAISALAWQSELEWLTTEKQLLAAIEGSLIRAATDGVVEAVYVRQNDYVDSSAVLGLVRGEDKQIVASAGSALGIYPGLAAVAYAEDKTLALIMKQVSVSDGNQLYIFEPVDKDALDGMEPGDLIEVEMTMEVCPTGALVPLAAVDADGYIWVVRNGRAYRQSIALDNCNRNYAQAPMSLAGETVVLYPEEREWKDGMRVQ